MARTAPDLPNCPSVPATQHAGRRTLAHHSKVLSVEQTYVIALLMGCSRCNQMRQLNIGKLADALEAWSPLVKLQSPATQSSLFALDPTVDKPPLYRTLFSDEQSPRLLGINTFALAEAINQYLALPDDQRTPSPLLIPTGINTDLLQHLAVAWGDVAERTFQRTPGKGTLRLCIGMSALHFYVAGQKSFSELLQLNSATSAASFSLKMANDDVDDPWASAFDTQRGNSSSVLLPYEEIEYPKNDGDSESLSNNQHTFPTFDLNIVNHSPGGYCLAWQKDVPQQLQAGELVGIQDDAGQGWSIAMVRWIRQVRSGGTDGDRTDRPVCTAVRYAADSRTAEQPVSANPDAARSTCHGKTAHRACSAPAVSGGQQGDDQRQR